MTIQLRDAVIEDLEALVTLEQACFTSDRISRRSFRYFLKQQGRIFLTAHDSQGELLGYVLALLHKGTRLARIYSICANPAVRGQGIGEQLVRAAEKACAEAGRIYMRLEVRKDNDAAIRLYRRLGYKDFGEIHDYYEDHEDALRLQKRILYLGEASLRLTVPYYSQSTDFTCGPAALLMTMAALQPDQPVGVAEELQIWREATTIYMMAGHGGCSPLGLALSAIRRGFEARVYSSQTTPLFVESVRDPEKKAVIKLVHETFLQQFESHGAEVQYEPITQTLLEQILERGALAIVLISTYRFDGKKVPHWVVVTAMDERFIYIHDPFIDPEEMRYAVDNQYLPVDRGDFDKMAQFGQNRLRAAVIISPR